ncbi:uncharacterized protein A4U43_C06F15980 [Asparagus officinalis]|uniref:Uncharacterized protein n=1 Tax=Asparagus officinalis TaxID=4686 RepID=A0A5P1EMH7_ASPOF|nr:uncharacterized protein A4U43_C06F15980 [Asparagus officinalis]
MAPDEVPEEEAAIESTQARSQSLVTHGALVPSPAASLCYDNSNEEWVLSVTSLSGAPNGTTRSYFDGMQPDDGRSMKSICLLQLCRQGVIVYDHGCSC